MFQHKTIGIYKNKSIQPRLKVMQRMLPVSLFPSLAITTVSALQNFLPVLHIYSQILWWDNLEIFYSGTTLIVLLLFSGENRVDFLFAVSIFKLLVILGYSSILENAIRSINESLQSSKTSKSLFVETKFQSHFNGSFSTTLITTSSSFCSNFEETYTTTYFYSCDR